MNDLHPQQQQQSFPSIIIKKKKKGEPHRIYWQQWITSSSSSSLKNETVYDGTTTTSAAGTTASWVLGDDEVDKQNNKNRQQQQRQKRELITSSAAIRLSKSAKVIDVTTLLRQTIQLPDLQIPSSIDNTSAASPERDTSTTTSATPTTECNNNQDCLVLVGTIYTLHKDYIQYQHILKQHHQQQQNRQGTLSSNNTSINENNQFCEPYHIIRTLQYNDHPLHAYEAMERYMNKFLQQYNTDYNNKNKIHDTNSINTSVTPSNNVHTTSSTKTNTSTTTPLSTLVSPKIQWHYIPAITDGSNLLNDGYTTANTNNSSMIPNCVELDGYCTPMEDDDDDEGDINKANSNHTQNNDRCDCDEIYMDDFDAITAISSSPILSTAEQKEQELISVFPWLANNSQNNDCNSSCDDDNNTNPAMNNEQEILQHQATGYYGCQYSKKVQRKLQYQEYLYNELCMAESQTPPHMCVSGYLLHRCNDKGNNNSNVHVWSRMFCILTNNELWYISRIYNRIDKHNNHAARPIATQQLSYRYVRYNRIRLTRAILIQPTTKEPYLYRIPYAFEIVSSNGTSYLFRTNNKQQHSMWTTSISDRIITSYENSLLDNAEMIMSEESYARNRRATALAVEPLWDQMVHAMKDATNTSSTTTTTAQRQSQISIGNSVGSVLRFGMDISIYKDRCRFVRSTMPPRTPIVVAPSTPSTSIRRRFFTSTSSSSTSISRDNVSSSTTGEVQYEPYDTYIQNMIRITWDQAYALLIRAKSLALTLQVRSSIKHDMAQQPQQHIVHTPGNAEDTSTTSSISYNKTQRLSHGVDTFCRHIEYILTGQRRSDTIITTAATAAPATMTYQAPNSTVSTTNTTSSYNIMDISNTPTGGSSTTQQQQLQLTMIQNDGPPPDDLFDPLLIELQSLAAMADHYHNYFRKI